MGFDEIYGDAIEGAPKDDSYAAYWKTVNAIYDDCIDPAVNTNIEELYNYNDDPSIEAIRDATLDFITESVDGSEWVTHPHYAQRGLTYTRNRYGMGEAYWLEISEDATLESLKSRAMYCAMMADIRELEDVMMDRQLAKAGS
jgi:hypothetical protein